MIDERRNPRSSTFGSILRDGNKGPTSNDDIGILQDDDNNNGHYDTAAAGGAGGACGAITVQQQTTTSNDSIEKIPNQLDHDDAEEADLGIQWEELLKSPFKLLEWRVRSYGDIDLIDLAALAIDYEVPRDHNSDDWSYRYKPFIIKCLEDEYRENRANICVELLNKEEEVHRKLIPRVIRKSSKDGDLSSVFYSLRSILVDIVVMYNTSPQPTREDVDTSIETSVTDVLSTPASDIDSREEEEGTNDVQGSVDTSFEDETIDVVVNNGGGDNINVSIESTAPSSLEGGGDNVMDVDVDFTNSGGDINMMDVNTLGASQHLEGKAMEGEGPPVETVDTTAVEACNNINAADITSPTTTNEAVVDITTENQQREDLSILTVVQLKDRLRGLNLAVGGQKQELIDRLNDHLYPALDAEESDAVGADSDVDMGMDSVNDEEMDVVVSDSVSRSRVIEKKVPRKRKPDNSLVNENADKKACIDDVSLVDSSILSKKNNDLFKRRTLHQITFTLPSDVDENELGISLDQNARFGRVGICGISNSSSLFDRIPSKYHKGWLLLAIEIENKLLELERCSDAINEMNKLRRGKQATLSIILAEPYINTLEEALAKWEELMDKKDFSTATKRELQVFAQVASVFKDYIEHVYSNRYTPDNAKYFFKDLKSFPSFDTVKQDASSGGTYIAKPSSRIPAKMGTSLTNCLQRTNRQSIKNENAYLFCKLNEALQMIPTSFIDRLKALDIPCLKFDPSHLEKTMQYCATLLNEATLTVIQPSITTNVADLLLHSPPDDVRQITDPHIAKSKIDKLRVGGHVKQGDQAHIVGSWPTMSFNMDQLRNGSLNVQELLEYARHALLQHHLPEKSPEDILKFFLFKQIFGEMYTGFTDCVEISPWLIRAIKVVEKMVAVMEEGDVLARYEEDGTVDDATKSKLEECLADMIEFAKVNKEYEPASDKEVASGCVKVLQMLVKSLPLNVLICIETSTYKALCKHEKKFYNKFFKGYDKVEVLANDKLKFRKHQSEEKHRFIVVSTPYIAFTVSDKATLAGRGTSLQSQNALIKVLMELGVVDKDKGEQVLARNRSFYNYLVWGGKDGKAGEGRIKLAIQLHLPPGMCKGHKVTGFGCLQQLLRLPYRTLLLFRLMMGPLMLNLVLDARGGSFGPAGCLPIEVNGEGCKGALAIGYYAATPCGCTKGGALMCMFKARDRTDPLFGHLVCHTCLKTSNMRLKTITAEVESFGFVINRITKIQPQISAVCNAFATDLSLVPNYEMKHLMQQNGLSVSDDNLVKLLTQWVIQSRRTSDRSVVRRVYTIRPYDVLPTAYGTNTVFRGIIEPLKPIYHTSQAHKTAVVDSVLKEWRTAKNGRFMTTVTGHPGLWEEMDDNSARERCIQAFEEAS